MGYSCGMGDSLLAVRIDLWLVAARIYKTRSLAQHACEGGRVKLNGQSVKASRALKRGDEVRTELAHGLQILVVLELAEKRLGAPAARLLYDDRSPPPVPKEERDFALRDRGAGRPTKADRRALTRLRED
jgi:ribosome-associated heat shock protein Hsp15